MSDNKERIEKIIKLFNEQDIYPFPYNDIAEIETELNDEFNKYASDEIIKADLNTYWMFIAGLASGGINSRLIDVVDRYKTKKWLEKSFFDWFPKYRFMERYDFSDYEMFNYTYQLYENLRIMLLDVIKFDEQRIQ